MGWFSIVASAMVQPLTGFLVWLTWVSIERRIGPLYPSRTGELAYPPLVMFKILLLQAWYGLSDPEMESAMDDRLLFGRFAGLSLEDEVPDHSTIWRFRERLSKSGLDQALFDEINRQLDGAGLMMKKGTLIDASLISSAARRPRMSEGKTSATDPEARFGTSNDRGRFEFGYKMHIGVDQCTALVRRVVLTSGNTQEIDMAKDLVCGDEAKLYADRGYDSQRLHDHLEAQQRNHDIAAIRKSVEKVFGTFKRHYQMGRMRYFRMARNRVRLMITAICYNLKRVTVIKPA
jgi:transposase, IS5 family